MRNTGGIDEWVLTLDDYDPPRVLTFETRPPISNESLSRKARLAVACHVKLVSNDSFRTPSPSAGFKTGARCKRRIHVAFSEPLETPADHES